jgi:hypothetical protein
VAIATSNSPQQVGLSRDEKEKGLMNVVDFALEGRESMNRKGRKRARTGTGVVTAGLFYPGKGPEQAPVP